jgi:hypothetical protein
MRGRAPPSHPESPQEPDRKQPQERQQQLQPPPPGHGCKGAPPAKTKKKSESESEQGDLVISPGPLTVSDTPTFYLPLLPWFFYIPFPLCPTLSAHFSVHSRSPKLNVYGMNVRSTVPQSTVVWGTQGSPPSSKASTPFFLPFPQIAVP